VPFAAGRSVKYLGRKRTVTTGNERPITDTAAVQLRNSPQSCIAKGGGMNRANWIFLGWLAFLTTSQAASFDCRKASSAVEKLICSPGNSELQNLDWEMNSSYLTVLQDEKQADAIRHSQKQWMKKRDACTNADCVRQAYKERLKVLVAAQRENAPPLISASKAEAICKEVLELTNTGKLKSQLLKFSNASEEDIKKWNREKPEYSDSRLVGILDVDYMHDGKLRHLGLIDSSGSCHGTGITDLGRYNNAQVGFSGSEIESDDNLRWAGLGRSQYILFVQNEPIVIDASFSQSNDDLALVSWFGEGQQRPLCAYSALGKVKVDVVESKDPDLCKAVASGEEEVVESDENSEEELADILKQMSFNKAEVITTDLNEDGTKDKLFFSDYSSGGGCGGDQQTLNFLKPSTVNSQVDPLETLLINFTGPLSQYSKEDWRDLHILTYANKPYLLAEGPDGVGVYSLWKNKIQTWCTYNLLEQFEIKKMYPPKR